MREVSIEGEDNLVHVDDLLTTSGGVSDLLLHGVEVLVYPRPVGGGKHHVLDDNFSLDSERLVEPLKLVRGDSDFGNLTVEDRRSLGKTLPRHLHKRLLVG